MKISKIEVNCPECCPNDITYSCEPECCFNHVCGNCLTTFQLSTKVLKDEIDDLEGKPAEKDSCEPTVQCARCESLDVFNLGSVEASQRHKLVCTSCLALLQLDVSDITPGQGSRG